VNSWIALAVTRVIRQTSSFYCIFFCLCLVRIMNVEVINLTDKVISVVLYGGMCKNIFPTQDEYPIVETDLTPAFEGEQPPLGVPIIYGESLLDSHLWEEWFEKHQRSIVVLPHEWQIRYLEEIADRYKCILVYEEDGRLIKPL